RFKRHHFLEPVIEFNVSRIESLNRHVLEFLDIINKLGLEVFLIDPIVLYQLIDDKHRQVLVDRDLLPDPVANDISGGKEYCLSFGVFTDNFQGVVKELSQVLTELVFEFRLIDGLDGSQRRFDKDFAQIDNTFLHMFYARNKECIQISVFHKRSDFLWVGDIPVHRSESYHNFVPKDIHYGKHESAFDSFGLEKLKTKTNITLLIPDRVVHFISQYKSSKFIECDYSLAINMSKNFTKSESMNRKVREAMIALKTFTSKLFIPFFISSGTLLGWYRQCGVIPYTTDVDTGTWATYASPQLIDKFIHNDVVLKLANIYGYIDNGLQFAFYTESHVRLDLFFMYRDGPNLTYTGHIAEERAYFRYIYPNFTLCSAELVGLKVLVPCNPVDVITAGQLPDRLFLGAPVGTTLDLGAGILGLCVTMGCRVAGGAGGGVGVGAMTL
ncbi:unnamed protein product, partial [Oppiella nova]